MLPLIVTGQPYREAARRARAALDKVGLLQREKANPVTLSGGEQQRLCVARAVVNRPAILLADRELSSDPVHVTVVGAKSDPAARTLFAAALALPGYKRVEWLDRREGALPNPDVALPETKRAAAFACSNGACSRPVFSADALAEALAP